MLTPTRMRKCTRELEPRKRSLAAAVSFLRASRFDGAARSQICIYGMYVYVYPCVCSVFSPACAEATGKTRRRRRRRPETALSKTLHPVVSQIDIACRRKVRRGASLRERRWSGGLVCSGHTVACECSVGVCTRDDEDPRGTLHPTH